MKGEDIKRTKNPRSGSLSNFQPSPDTNIYQNQHRKGDRSSLLKSGKTPSAYTAGIYQNFSSSPSPEDDQGQCPSTNPTKDRCEEIVEHKKSSGILSNN